MARAHHFLCFCSLVYPGFCTRCFGVFVGLVNIVYTWYQFSRGEHESTQCSGEGEEGPAEWPRIYVTIGKEREGSARILNQII